MKVTVINGTNRIGNKCIQITKCIKEIALKLNYHVKIVNIENFSHLFRGEYILVVDLTNESQYKELDAIKNAEVLLFVVPIYPSSTPSALKNFLGLTSNNDLYRDKIIGLVGSSDNRDSVINTTKVLNKLLTKFEKESLVLSRTISIDYENIDTKKIKDYLIYCNKFVNINSRFI